MINSKWITLLARGNELPSVGGRSTCPGSFVVALFVAMAATLALDARAQGKMYKWVDESGLVHYTDKMPPDAVDKGSIELNKQGIQIRKTAPATTPEQRRARETEDERVRQDAKEQQEIARRDRALLDSYTSEEDIDLARNRALRTVELSLQSAQAYSAQLTKRKEGMVARKAAPADKTVPAANERELARIDTDLARQAELIARKKTEMTALAGKYDGDKERWRAAKARADAQRSAPTPAAGTAMGVTQPGKARK